jgi:hypothetical protein
MLFLIKPLLNIIKKEGMFTGTNFALLISVPLSPYGFNFDHIVVLPAVVQLIAWLCTQKLPKKYIILISAYLLIIDLIIIKMISINGLDYYWFFWIPLAILLIYFVGWKIKDESPDLRP